MSGTWSTRPGYWVPTNREELKAEIEAAGVTFDRDEPGGGIIGAAGLLLGMGGMRGIDAVCLMGETSGYIVDPMSAASVLSVLSKLISVPVDPTQLNDRAAEMEKVVQGFLESEKTAAGRRTELYRLTPPFFFIHSFFKVPYSPDSFFNLHFQVWHAPEYFLCRKAGYTGPDPSLS